MLSFQYITPFAFVLPWFWYLSKKTKIVKNIDNKNNLILRIVGKKYRLMNVFFGCQGSIT